MATEFEKERNPSEKSNKKQKKMKIAQIFAQLIFVSFFLYCGYVNITNPSYHKEMLITGYQRFYSALLNDYQIKLPSPYFDPVAFEARAETTLFATGILEVVCSLAILVTLRKFAYLLAIQMFVEIVLIYNPFTTSNKQEYIQTTIGLLQMLAILGSCLLIAGAPSCKKPCKKAETKTKHKKTQ